MAGVRPPFQPGPVSEQRRRRWDAAFPVFAEHGLAPFGPSGFLLAADAGPLLRDCHHTPVQPGDTWVVSLPKCGTTWTQELVWLVQNNCDFVGAASLLCPDRYHFLDAAAMTAKHKREKVRRGDNPVSKRNFFGDIRERSRPWFVKTHLPLHLCPPGLLDTAKVVYVSRNPKDMCVSYYNHLKLFEECDSELRLDDFADLFIAGEVSQLPFFPHVLEAWNQRQHPNLLFLFFEDLKRDLRGSITRVAEFLGKSLTEDQLSSLETHLSFSKMKDNPWVNKSVAVAYAPLKAEQLTQETAAASPAFMRRGETGDWKNHLSEQTSAMFDRWIDRELFGTGLSFVMELEPEKRGHHIYETVNPDVI